MFQHYDNLIEKENIKYNYSKANYKNERNFELTLYYNDINHVSGVKSQFPIVTTIEYPKNITVNLVHDSLEWLKFVDDTNSTNTKASEKSCNWAAYYQENMVQELQIPCSSVLLPLISTSNHMFKREIWNKFTQFTFLKFGNHPSETSEISKFLKLNEVNFPQISRISMWFLVNHMLQALKEHTRVRITRKTINQYQQI